ncbi:MAG: NAD+ synthase [Thaumarchaeota archaeon]|nr:NAD+ synthase [Nitrososphaerota archaeon]
MQSKSESLSLDYRKVEKEILQFIRKIVADAGSKGAVIGLSGGIDSAVVGALLVRALGKDKVVGILMPASHTPKQDTDDGRAMAESWGIRLYDISIDPIFSAFERSLPKEGETKIANANVKARIRMIINYYVANAHGMLVAGTGDKSEDEIGFFTKYGDGGVDFLPIAHLYKTQVRELGAHLGLPENVVSKPSSPQLWPGHKAVDEIPIEYERLDHVLVGLFDEKLPPADVAKKTGVDLKVVEDVIRRHRNSAHKRAYPPMLGGW